MTDSAHTAGLPWNARLRVEEGIARGLSLDKAADAAGVNLEFACAVWERMDALAYEVDRPYRTRQKKPADPAEASA